MSDVLGGLFGNQNTPQQGPFNFGPSLFDLIQLLGAGQTNKQAIHNRYAQLGMDPSTPETQDLAGADLQTNAAIGQEQTSSVTNPAINTALQSPIATGNPSSSQSLGNLASSAGTLLGNLG